MRRPRVALVSSNRVRAPYPVPPLGVCLVAEALRESYDVRVVDAGFCEPAELERAVAEHEPDCVGVGIRNVDDMVMRAPEFFVDDVARQVIDPIRRATKAPLVLGGAGFSIFPGPLMERLGGDYGVVGEGERALPVLLSAIEGGEDPLGIPGVVTPGRTLPSGAAPRPDAGSLGPSRLDEWIDFGPYARRGSYPIQTRRGCSRRCVYCTYPGLEGVRERLRSPTSVADEIEAARSRLGAVTFEVVDSTFNIPEGHAEAICDEIVRRGLGVKLRTMGVNPSAGHGRLVEKMLAAGFVQVDCTPDSGSDRMLGALGKGFSSAELRESARALRELGMPTMWFFLLGGPGEDESTVAETFELIDEHVAADDMVHLSVGLRVYPGTVLHRRAVDEGVVAGGDDLLEPSFYVSPALGADRLHALVEEACASRPACVPAWESTPSPEMIRMASALREAEGLDEPMFRTLIRLRRQGLAS